MNNHFHNTEEKQDHREIAKDLELYFLDEKSGQGLPMLLPNWVIVRNQLQNFLRQKQKEYGFQEVITPVLGNEWLYQTSGHLSHYQDYMFPKISRNNESYYLRPMTCPHHCLIYQQKPRSYRELPFRLCENSLLFRYETSGSMKGLERTRMLEMADHHVFADLENLKEELKVNYYFIKDILANLNFSLERIICAIHDPTKKEKYHADEELWKQSEKLLIETLEEMKITYLVQKGEAAFYGPKIDFEVKAADNKYITISTIQLDFLLPQKFNLQYIDSQQKLQKPIILHQSPIGTYGRFISLLLEKTQSKLPFWLTPVQLIILPLNDQKEIMEYSKKLQKELLSNDLRSEIWNEKTLNYRIKQVHLKKIPYYLVIGKEEIEKKKLKLVCTYFLNKVNELTENELFEKLVAEKKLK